MLALLSGGITSGVGYAFWYAALPQLPKTMAAVVQLIVRFIAAASGIVFASEVLTFNFVIALLLAQGGILAVTLSQNKPVTITEKNA